MKKLLLIYNPHSGKGRLAPHLSTVVEQLSQAGWVVTVCPTRGQGHAARLAARLGAGFDRVVCCGGDGTLHETVTGLMSLSQPPVLGYIPAGTTNDFSRNLNLPRGFRKLAAAAGAGVPRSIDLGRFNGRLFVYIAAFGAFTDVAYATPQPLKNLLGHLAYLLEGAAKLGRLRGYYVTVEHDGHITEGEYLFGMVSNTVSVGGLLGLPRETVSLDDGLLETVLVRMPHSRAELRAAVSTLLRHTTDPAAGVEGFHAAKLSITCGEEVPWTLDGEFGGGHTEVQIETCAQALTIVYGK